MDTVAILVFILLLFFVYRRSEHFQIDDNPTLVDGIVKIENNDNIKFQQQRDLISYCKTPGCVEREHTNCNKFCGTIRPELTEKCTSLCDDVTQRKQDAISYQYKIFGSAYDFFRDFSV